MPWTIYRYAIFEMLKMMLSATLCLTLIISFAGAIKPLSEGLLDGVGLMRYLAFSAPMMLQFSLPFATVFAGTLLYNRLVADNEVLALSSCGVSYRAILLPAVFLGLSLSLVMFLLSNAIVPSLFGHATRMIKQDFLTMVVRQVQQQQAIELPGKAGLWIYADRADASMPPPTFEHGPQPQRMIVLEGVAVGKVKPPAQVDAAKSDAGDSEGNAGEDKSRLIMTSEGQMTQESTAQRAIILLFEEDGESWVSLRLENAMTIGTSGAVGDISAMDEVAGNKNGGSPMAGKGQIESIDIFRQPLPNRFRDQPKYKTWFELVALSQRPEGISRVAQEKKALAHTLAITDIKTQLAMVKPGQPMRFTSGGANYQVIAPARELKGNTLLMQAQENSPVVIDVSPVLESQRTEAFNAGQFAVDRSRRMMLCKKAELKLRTPQPGEGDQPLIMITLHDVRIFSQDDELENEHKLWPLPPMSLLDGSDGNALVRADYHEYDVWFLMNLTLQKIKTLKAQNLLTEADQKHLKKMHFRMDYFVRRISHRVLAQFNLRTAHAISCCLTLLLGAMLSLRLREKMPLVVFFWSFLVSVAVLITLLGGESLTKQGKNDWWIGVAVNWSGTLLLGGYLTLLYRRISRN